MTGKPEFVDVLVIGAGLAGIGSACQFRRKMPQLKLAILEARQVSGGTWDLFRYPGIRSDSDMYTYSYGFKPWTAKSAIADGDTILKYIRETAEEYGLNQLIRYNHKVVSAHWSSQDKLWTVTVARSPSARTDSEEQLTIQCRFILSCTGYFDYEQGYTPEFAGIDDFQGEIVHPQFWPEQLDYKDKRVVIIGSGATAVTLVPSMADDTASLVMLQRSPTYIANVPAEDPWLKPLTKYLPNSWVFRSNSLEESTNAAVHLPPLQKEPTRLTPLLAQRGAQRTGPGLRCGHPLHAQLQPLGSAPVRRARWRYVQRHP